MSDVRTIFGGFPKFLQPKILLFLSIDLVGSTAHKQSPSFPVGDPDEFYQEGEVHPSWMSPIGNFYSRYGILFEENWKKYKQKLEKNSIPYGEDPALWKANGDELIYIKEIKNRKELYGCLDAWYSTVIEYRAELHKTP